MNSVSDNIDKKLEKEGTSTIRTEPSTTLTVPFDSNRQGEVFICSEDTSGLLESLPIFKGRMVNSLGGGFNKLYVIQDTEDNEGIVSSLHPPEVDEFDPIFSQDSTVQDPFEYLSAFDDKGTLYAIRAGKKHLVVLTESGHVYSWGYGEYGVLGLSGVVFSKVPQLLKSLSDKIVVQIACGEYHTLALTNKGDVYSWGRGFEGQLGLALPKGEGGIKHTSSASKHRKLEQRLQQNGSKLGIDSDEDESEPTLKLKKNQPLYNPGKIDPYHMQTASTPKYLRFFFNNSVKYIACGAYFSFAISTAGQLFGWGENKMGQIGCDYPFKFDAPHLIDVKNQALPGRNFEGSAIHMKITLRTERDYSVTDLSESVKFKQVAGGFGHTVALTEDGDIYTWGFNIKGQLGVGEMIREDVTAGSLFRTKEKLIKPPSRLFSDQLSNPLPKFNQIACGYYTSFGIDENGALYSWGGGPLGHKDDQVQDIPRKVEAYTENRKFKDIYCTMKSSLFFAPIRVISMQPRSGPSSGGTLISLLGTGFCDTGRQKVRFVFGKHRAEVECSFNATSEGLYCTSPKFDDFEDAEELWPLEVSVSLSLDGTHYIPAEEKFLVYSSTIAVISMQPKCASITGGSTLTLDINLDDDTAAKLKDFTVGFQAKKFETALSTVGISEERSGSNAPSQSDLHHNPSSKSGTPKDKSRGARKLASPREATNPLGVNVTSPELDKEDWICVRGFYQKGGKVNCTIPQIEIQGEKNLYFNVDVSLNGQQFTGIPSSFKFYDINVEKMGPNNDISDGGSTVYIDGNGFIDSEAKKLKFISKFGERLVDLVWVKASKQYSFIVPPISWLFGGDIPTPEQIQDLKATSPTIQITVNGIEWIEVGKFSYFDPEYERITPAVAPENGEKWATLEEEIDPFATCKNENEIEKKKVELAKITQQEDDDINLGYKKAGMYLWLRGKNFIKGDLYARVVAYNKAYPAKAVYKNRTRVGLQLPELEDVPLGVHEIQIELSYNGQQFYKGGKVLKYMAFDKNMTEAEKKKFEDEEAKKMKAPAHPKKGK